MNLKIKFTLVVTLLLNTMLFAQNGFVLTGQVSSSTDGLSLPGASVLVQGKTNGASTDFDGKYSIQVKKGDIVNFSFIGFNTKSVTVGEQKVINVALDENINKLEDVVVVGYGTRKKSHLTGAISKIGGEEVAAIQAARVDDALAGKLSGVRIQNQSGEPGADAKIQIRAASSISGDSGPLIVVDGYPISGNIATINPNDIESLEVLKDAASSAIYGSRGANGVILVTTKKGKSGKLNFNYNSYTSASRKYVKDIEMLKTASEWADDLQSGAYDLSNTNPTLLKYRLDAYRNAPDVVNMEDYIFKNGNTINHDLSVSGGSENIKAFASLGYLNTEGVGIGQAFKKYNARMNVDANLSEKLKAGISLNGFYSHQDIMPWEMRDLLRAYSISPIYHTASSIAFVQALDAERARLFALPVANGGYTGSNFNRTFDQDYRGIGLDPTSIYNLQPGDIVHDWHYGRNLNGIGGTGDAGVAAKVDNSQRYKKTYFANMNSYLQYNITKGLDVKTLFGADVNNTHDYYYRGILSDGQQRSNQTNLDISDIKKSSVLSVTTLDYSKVIEEKHDFSTVVGIEFQNTYFNGLVSNGTNVPFNLPLNYSFFKAADVVSYEIDQTISRRSVFGRLNYAFDNRYLASVSLRRDGDSRFGSNKKFATFPAISLGWNVHNEAFWNPLSNIVSTFKPRFSTGSQGTESFLGAYDSKSVLNTAQTAFGLGILIPGNLANSDLTWQTNQETNYGIDTGFLKNRFKFSFDYYTTDINNMLLKQSVSEVFGTPSLLLNRGDIQSKGLEFELNANILHNENFSWSMNGNLSTVKTEIMSLGDLTELPRQIYGGPGGRGPEFRNYVGGEIGEMWGYAVSGEVESTNIADPSRNIGLGSSEYYVIDQNGDGQITYEGDYVKLGSATPDFYWGLSSNMNYKNFDFSFQIQGSQGGEVYNIDPIYWKSQFGNRLNTSFDAVNNTTNAPGKDGRADATGKFYKETKNAHGAGIQDASFTALRNITFGYSFKSDLTSKIGINSLRLYAAATNLLYLMADNYTSYNPEGIETGNTGYAGPTTYGYQEGASPVVKSFTFGLNVNF